MRLHLPEAILIAAGLAIAGAALFLIFAPKASAADQDHLRPHDLVLIFAKPFDQRSHMVLADYDSRESCRNAIVRVRVVTTGARLQCVATRAQERPTAPSNTVN